MQCVKIAIRDKQEFTDEKSEKYNQIIDEVYENYKWKQLKLFPSPPDSNLSKEEFFIKCKTDPEFSEKCGLKIWETYDLIPYTENFGDVTITKPIRRNKVIVVYKEKVNEFYNINYERNTLKKA